MLSQACYGRWTNKIAQLTAQVAEQAEQRAGARLLMNHPGVGPVTALGTMFSWAIGALLWDRSQRPPLIECPLSAHWAERRFAKMDCKSGGLLPFPRTGCVPNAGAIVAQNDDEGSTPPKNSGESRRWPDQGTSQADGKRRPAAQKSLVERITPIRNKTGRTGPMSERVSLSTLTTPVAKFTADALRRRAWRPPCSPMEYRWHLVCTDQVSSESASVTWSTELASQ